jgi:mRNA-degrading endonuclease YafQ of YafQ-DinJ toxin-antitoxin module
MYEVRMTKTFRKDTERCRKRGYDMELLKTAIRLLEANLSRSTATVPKYMALETPSAAN